MNQKKFYIVYEREGEENRGPHVVSTQIPGTQELLEKKFEPTVNSSRRDCTPEPTTRYLYREKDAESAKQTPLCGNSPRWANYVLDHNEESTPYATFEEAEEALNAQPPPFEENL